MEKELQFRSNVSYIPLEDLGIVDDEDISLHLQPTLKDATKEFIRLEEQESLLSDIENTVKGLQKELELLQADIRGYQNEVAYLDNKSESELSYINGAIILSRSKKQELAARLDENRTRREIVLRILESQMQQLEITKTKLKDAEIELRKLMHVRLRIKTLFNRVFRQSNSAFTIESQLHEKRKTHKAELNAKRKQLKRIEDSRDEIAQIIRKFSQSLQEIFAQKGSEKDKKASYILLVCQSRMEYAKVRKPHACIPSEFPPITASGGKVILDEISIEDPFSEQDLRESLAAQQGIVLDLAVVINLLKSEITDLESQVLTKKVELDQERRRIFHGLILHWDRLRVYGDSATDPDLPPPYDDAPKYEDDSETDADDVPLNLIKLNSTLGIREPCISYQDYQRQLKGGKRIQENPSAEIASQESSTSRRKRRFSVPLIDMIDTLRESNINDHNDQSKDQGIQSSWRSPRRSSFYVGRPYGSMPQSSTDAIEQNVPLKRRKSIFTGTIESIGDSLSTLANQFRDRRNSQIPQRSTPIPIPKHCTDTQRPSEF